MATAVAPKPSAPHQAKMKRPPPPAVQTNGLQLPRSSTSPSASLKRPPGFKQPPTPTVNGVNGDANGLGSRLSNRRKDSHKPGDPHGRPNRSGRGPQDGEKKAVKRMTEPYVKTQSYILKRHRNKPPSLIIHLHPTHFRFDTQDGSFSYNSPMKFVLEHLKSQTIPHDMMEELTAAGTRFYEGCLIVQVQDHRSNSGPSSTSTSTSDDEYVPFSLHNPSPYLCPSPYVPYPKKAEFVTNVDASKTTPQQGTSIEAKGNDPTKGPNIFHVVLFPTPLSLHEEVVIQANTVDPRQNSRKQSSTVPRTPASATVPPTPSLAVPATPSAGAPPTKKQKMSISGNELHEFESKLVQTTAPPLFLEPIEDLMSAQKVLENLTDPLHKEAYPAPKIKKRTVAELAADEAIAAQEEAFMLIFDEKHTSGLAGAKAGTADGDARNGTFQGDFRQFQTIKRIKLEHKERAARELEAKAIRDATQQANKLRQEQQERAAKQDMERRAAQLAQEQLHTSNVMRQNQMNREAQAREMRQVLAANQNQTSHPHGHPMPNGVSQAQKSSPTVQNGTPRLNSSPAPGNIPMNVTSHGITSSPARPSSAMQHAPTSGVGMARQNSRQQASSRTGTPQTNGTPAMQHSTPVLGHNATPRVPQGSPPIGTNPAMNHNVLANQHMNGNTSQFSPEQQQAQIEHRRLQTLYAQRQHAQLQQLHLEQMQNGSPNPQMSPEQRTAAQMQNLQHQAALNQQRQSTQEYQQSLRMHHAAMTTGPGNHPNMPHAASSQQQHLQPGQPQQRMPMQLTPQQKQHLSAQIQINTQSLLTQTANAKYGGNLAAVPPAERVHCEQRARQAAQEQFKKYMLNQTQRLREQQHLQQMAAVNGMNGMGGQGMNGVNVQGTQDQQRQMMMHRMQQMSQMPHVGGNGVQNVNGMMHGGQHMNGGGMGGMQ